MIERRTHYELARIRLLSKIKADPTRGGHQGQNGARAGWGALWAKRWVAVLESFSLGARLTRGRAYARRGQVLSVDITPGVVTAKVQGSRATPYKVTMKLAPLSAEKWERVISELSGRALFLAKLLAGEMPAEIEEVFRAAGAPLFPAKYQDMTTECHSPDSFQPVQAYCRRLLPAR